MASLVGRIAASRTAFASSRRAHACACDVPEVARRRGFKSSFNDSVFARHPIIPVARRIADVFSRAEGALLHLKCALFISCCPSFVHHEDCPKKRLKCAFGGMMRIPCPSLSTSVTIALLFLGCTGSIGDATNVNG